MASARVRHLGGAALLGLMAGAWPVGALAREILGPNPEEPIAGASAEGVPGAEAPVDGAPQPEAASESEAAALARVVRDGALSERERLEAATHLVTLCSGREPAALVEAILNDHAGEASGLVLRAIVATPEACESLGTVLARVLAGVPGASVPRYLEALGSIRTREAARVLVGYLDDPRNGAIRTGAEAALRRLSGLSAAPEEGWAGWLARAEEMPDWEWRRTLLATFVRRGESLRDRTVRLRERLIESQRRLHALMPPGERGAFLASLLDDPEAGARLLGLELTTRELSQSGSVSPEIGPRVLRLLSDPDPAQRAGAARIVRQLAPEGSGEAVARALAVETDPEAASALLLAGARWPSPALREPSLAWMEREGPARNAAAEAVWQLFRAAELDPANQRRALRAARAFADDALEPPVMGLLASLGTAEDRARIAPLIAGESRAKRVAAARALVWYPEHLEAILAAAATDVDLFDIASRALVLHQATAAGYRRLLALPRPSPDVAIDALDRLASVLNAADLWVVASECTDPAERRRLLRELSSEGRRLSEWIDPEQRAAISRGMLALARMRIDDNTPDNALALLEGVEFDGTYASEGLALRCEALLALGRVEDALPLETGPGAWLRGLALSLRKPHAGAILAVIDSRYGETLSADQRAILDAARASIAPGAGATSGTNGGTTPR